MSAAPNIARVCEGCGCTEGNACLDRQTGRGCYWVDGYVCDICSVCAKVIAALAGAGALHVAV